MKCQHHLSFYAPYTPGTENNSQPWGWFKIAQEAVKGTQNYARAWDNDYVLIGHSAYPFVRRGGYCGNGSGAGVLVFYITEWPCAQLPTGSVQCLSCSTLNVT